MSLFRKRSTNKTERLREILLENLPRSTRRSDVQMETTLRELGVDSLGLILVITCFCEEFDIKVEALAGNLSEIRTVGDLLAAGEQYLAQRNG